MALSARGIRLALWGAVGIVVVAGAVTWRQFYLKQNPPTTVPGDAAQASADSSGAGPFEGKPALEFVARNVYTSKNFKLSDLKGEPVLLNFWATWCPPCRQEMPDLETFAKENPGVKVVAIGADSQEDPMKLAGFAKAMGLSFTIGADEGAAASKYRVLGIPTSFFIDKDGVIRVRHQGAMTLEEMRTAYTSMAQNANK